MQYFLILALSYSFTLPIELPKANNEIMVLDLNASCQIQASVENFETKNHQIDYCSHEQEKGFCLIDGQPWFGGDGVYELPQTQLKSFSIIRNGKNIPLEVSGMFNPNINITNFYLKKEEVGHQLYSFFSDGAGTYTASWKIVNGQSIRTMLSNNESHFQWQNEIEK